MKLIICLILLSFSVSSFAVSGVGGCTATVNGQAIAMKATMGDIFSLETGKAEVSIGGRLVARFDGADMKVNIMARTFTITNSQGDSASGKLTNVFRKSGVVYHMDIPAYGISYKDFPVKCWSKRN